MKVLALAVLLLAARNARAEPPAEVPAGVPAEGPDVELHVPRAEIASLSLDVENLQARLDVDTSVAELVHVRAGVVATVQKLKAEMEGVSAETHLVVRLNRVSDVLQQALAAIEQNPELAAPVASAPVVPADGAGPIAIDAATHAHPAPPKPNAE